MGIATTNHKRPAGPKIHEIKIDTIFFPDVMAGVKRFELRKNDRDYRVGDILKMMEYDHGRKTGRFVIVKVTYMLESYTGLDEGYCIMQTEGMNLQEAALEAAKSAGALATDETTQPIAQYGA